MLDRNEKKGTIKVPLRKCQEDVRKFAIFRPMCFNAPVQLRYKSKVEKNDLEKKTGFLFDFFQEICYNLMGILFFKKIKFTRVKE